MCCLVLGLGWLSVWSDLLNGGDKRCMRCFKSLYECDVSMSDLDFYCLEKFGKGYEDCGPYHRSEARRFLLRRDRPGFGGSKINK